jgi:hypothetical protein
MQHHDGQISFLAPILPAGMFENRLKRPKTHAQQVEKTEGLNSPTGC